MRNSVTKDTQCICDSLCHPSSLKLMFRASEHSFSAEAFHRHCDKAEDTFVLVHTEFGKTIGAYSHYTWEAKEDQKGMKENGRGNVRVTDSCRRAFLLLMDQQQKVVPQIDAGIIYCNNGCGPQFGGYIGMAALKIGDKCNSEANSTTYGIGGQYSTEGTDKKYGWLKQQTWIDTSGATEGHLFKVLEY